jgi:hypothetical protein
MTLYIHYELCEQLLSDLTITTQPLKPNNSDELTWRRPSVQEDPLHAHYVKVATRTMQYLLCVSLMAVNFL